MTVIWASISYDFYTYWVDCDEYLSLFFALIYQSLIKKVISIINIMTFLDCLAQIHLLVEALRKWIFEARYTEDAEEIVKL